MNLTNKTNLPLSVAVFLAADSYNFKPNSNSLSATDLGKSTRALVLRNRISEANVNLTEDILDRYHARIGHAVHDAIERVWLDPVKYTTALQQLGYSQDIIDRVIVNPEPHELYHNCIPVYLEKRVKKEIEGYTISGQFDIVFNGQLQDYKTTSVYAFEKGLSTDKFRLQGSIYRWLNPDLITKDTTVINYLFKDWSGNKAKGSNKYPQAPAISVPIKLLSLEETEAYIRNKIRSIEQLKNSDESVLPHCSSEELWQDSPTYKYYSKVGSSRCAKGGDYGTDSASAFARLSAEGNVGEVRMIQQPAKACNYCPANSMCSQFLELSSLGLIS